jgi:hypothetical protein
LVWHQLAQNEQRTASESGTCSNLFSLTNKTMPRYQAWFFHFKTIF